MSKKAPPAGFESATVPLLEVALSELSYGGYKVWALPSYGKCRENYQPQINEGFFRRDRQIAHGLLLSYALPPAG
jgi:hypothetical protein